MKLGALYFVGCVIRTVIVGAHGAPYDSIGKAGQRRGAGRTAFRRVRTAHPTIPSGSWLAARDWTYCIFVGCVIRTVIVGAHGTPYDSVGKAEHNCPACRVYHGGITE
jgi:hypothetical protein